MAQFEGSIHHSEEGLGAGMGPGRGRGLVRLPLHISVGQEAEHRECWHPRGFLLSPCISSTIQPTERCHSEAQWIFPSSAASL